MWCLVSSSGVEGFKNHGLGSEPDHASAWNADVTGGALTRRFRRQAGDGLPPLVKAYSDPPTSISPGMA